jgi:transcriptional regulator with XRE-family HTH domain
MSTVTIEKVKVNPAKFKEVRGNVSRAEHAEMLGINADMVAKIENGKRWLLLEKFAAYCQKVNREPNDFFEIVKKIS